MNKMNEKENKCGCCGVVTSKCALISYLVVGLLFLSYLINPEVLNILGPILMPIGIVCGLIVIIGNIRRDMKWLIKSDDDENQSK